MFLAYGGWRVVEGFEEFIGQKGMVTKANLPRALCAGNHFVGAFYHWDLANCSISLGSSRMEIPLPTASGVMGT